MANKNTEKEIDDYVHHYGHTILFLSTGTILSLILLTPWAEQLQNTNLAFHMLLEHSGFVASSIFLCYGVENLIKARKIVSKKQVYRYSRLISYILKLNVHGRLSVPVIIIIFGYWHIPENWVLVAQSTLMHDLMHLSFIIAGVFFYIDIKSVSKHELFFHTFLAMGAMVVTGIILIYIPNNIFIIYPLQQHHDTGIIMSFSHPLIFGLLLIYIVSYILQQEPKSVTLNSTCNRCGEISKHIQITGKDESYLLCVKCKNKVNLIPFIKNHKL